MVLGERRGRVNRGTDHLVDPFHQSRTAGLEIVLLVTVELVTQQRVHLVPVREGPVVSYQLVKRVGHVTVVVLVDQTAVRRLVAVFTVEILHVVRNTVIHAEIDRAFQPLKSAGAFVVAAEREVGAGREALGRIRGRVVVKTGDGVAVVVLRTGFAVVKLLFAVGVEQVVAVLVLHVNGIDRSHELRRIEDIAVRGARITVRVGLRVGEVGVHTALEPVLGRRIVAHTTRITLEIGGFEHTVLMLPR